MFPLPASVHRGIPTPTAPFKLETLSKLHRLSAGFSGLCSGFAHLIKFAKLASSMPSEDWLSDQDIQSNFLLAAHKILSVPRHIFSNSPSRSLVSNQVALREAIRLALLLFMLGQIAKLVGNHNWELNYSGRLPALLKGADIDWNGLEDLELWVLVIGALHEKGSGREWLVARISRRIAWQQLTWNEAIQRVSNILWVNEAFTEFVGVLEEDCTTQTAVLQSYSCRTSVGVTTVPH